MKIVLRLLFTITLVGIFVGFYTRTFQDYALGEKIIGFSVLFGVVMYMPLFLVVRWKGKRLKDYTLTPENLAKIKEKSDRK